MVIPTSSHNKVAIGGRITFGNKARVQDDYKQLSETMTRLPFLEYWVQNHLQLRLQVRYSSILEKQKFYHKQGMNLAGLRYKMAFKLKMV